MFTNLREPLPPSAYVSPAKPKWTWAKAAAYFVAGLLAVAMGLVIGSVFITHHNAVIREAQWRAEDLAKADGCPPGSTQFQDPTALDPDSSVTVCKIETGPHPVIRVLHWSADGWLMVPEVLDSQSWEHRNDLKFWLEAEMKARLSRTALKIR